MRRQRLLARSRSVEVGGASQQGPLEEKEMGQLTVPRLGTAKSGRESKAPMVSAQVLSCYDIEVEGSTTAMQNIVTILLLVSSVDLFQGGL